MIAIPDDTTLRLFIPNSFRTLDGQPALYDKISPFLRSAEIWFCSNFMDSSTLAGIVDRAQSQDDELYFLTRRIIALKAWINALPSIDVVVTANGLGTVESQTLKPASKAKVDRLLSTAQADLEQNISSLIGMLHTIPGWLSSDAAERFRATLFPGFGILRQLGITSDLWDNWLSLSQKISAVEDTIADSWVSRPLMRRLREKNLSRTLDPLELRIVTNVKAAVRRIMTDPTLRTVPAGDEWKALPQLEEAVNIIRENICRFPEWKSSPVARLFSAPVFRNRADSSAFFF